VATSIGAILVLSLVAGLVVLAPRLLGAARVGWSTLVRPAPPPSADPDTVVPGLTPAAMMFTDPQHGYLLIYRCVSGDIRQCTYELYATDDGGRGWSRRTVPLAAGAAYLREPLHVLPEDYLILDEPVFDTSGTTRSNETAAVEPQAPPRRWLSRDGGRTWTEISTRLQGTVAEVPVGGYLIVTPWVDPRRVPATWEEIERLSRPFQVLRPDGTMAALEKPPFLFRFLIGPDQPVIGADGSIWLATNGLSATQPVSLMVSPDRGRSWRDVSLPGVDTPVQINTVDGRYVYLLNYANSGETRLLYSTDAGQRWQEKPMLPWSRAGDYPPRVAALPDSGLLVVSEERVYRAAPGMLATAEVTYAPPLTSVVSVGARLFARDARGTFYISVDGAHWDEVRLP